MTSVSDNIKIRFKIWYIRNINVFLSNSNGLHSYNRLCSLLQLDGWTQICQPFRSLSWWQVRWFPPKQFVGWSSFHVRQQRCNERIAWCRFLFVVVHLSLIFTMDMSQCFNLIAMSATTQLCFYKIFWDWWSHKRHCAFCDFFLRFKDLWLVIFVWVRTLKTHNCKR